MIQIGSRNMHNFTLLRAAGQGRTPVLLKRGFGATIDEWLMAAEYVLSAGNANVILCERGIRTFEHATRNTLDLSAVPVLREMTHLPVMVDPSHGTGKRSLVTPMALAAAAVGADGLIIEVHPDPPHAPLRRRPVAVVPRVRRADGRAAAPGVPAPRGAGGTTRRAGSGQRRAACASASTRSTSSCCGLVDERAQLAIAIQDAKDSNGHGHDAQREHDLLERARSMSGSAMDGEELAIVLSAVVRASRQMQRRHAAAQRDEMRTPA